MAFDGSAEENVVTGYLHPGYAESLREFGTPRELPRCKGWILERAIPGFPYRDAMGCYPLFCCQEWPQLQDDLEALGEGLVSVALVTDPFGAYDRGYLEQCFRDVVIPFKDHFITDLHSPMNSYVSRNRRKKVRRALGRVAVEECQEPERFLSEWERLYAYLAKRHTIGGIRAFSSSAFARQLAVPGMVMFRAVCQEGTVGAALWYVQGEVAYGHLAACNEAGYRINASYALDWYAIVRFTDRVRWLDWGGGAGILQGSTDGLSAYKRGWSTHSRMAYFCGRIYDRRRYVEIAEAKGIRATRYFPAYRLGEFPSADDAEEERGHEAWSQ